MVHKLQISYKLDPKNPVSGRPYRVLLQLQNIGDSIFAGGKLTRFRVNYGVATLDMDEIALRNYAIPQVKVNETVELGPHEFYAITDGVSWIEVIVEANDKEEVELFQTLTGKGGQPWRMPFMIENGQNREIIELLRKISDQLSMLVEKFDRVMNK